jgi:hypothetical protein
MEDAHLRMQIHDALERKIHEMEGGARRRRRMPAMHYRAPPGMIYNKHGKLVSYKKHLQGKRLAAKYGFTKHGSKTTKRRTRRKMTGYGDGGHMYGMGYVPALYGKNGPDPKVAKTYAYCKKGVPGPEVVNGPVFFNQYTGKCEKALYGQELKRARLREAEKLAKRRVPKYLTKRQIAEREQLATIYDQLEEGVYNPELAYYAPPIQAPFEAELTEFVKKTK